MPETPLILPAVGDNTEFQGCIYHQGKQYSLYFRCKCPNGPVHLASLLVDDTLQRLWSKLPSTAIKTRLEKCPDPLAFAKELQDILQESAGAMEATDGTMALPSPRYYSRVRAELERVGWEVLEEVGEDFQTVHFCCQDKGGRRHSLVVRLPGNYPSSPPECQADLPFPFEPVWKGGMGLVDVVRQFRDTLHKYQALWEALDDLDLHTWVVGSEKNSRASLTRRLLVGRGSSVVLTLNPLDPNKVSDINFIGPETTIGPLRQKVYANLARWDPSKLPRHNLEALFGMTLPSPPSTTTTGGDKNEGSLAAECAICYAQNLSTKGGGSLPPDRVCGNPKCGRVFHAPCLLDWLHSLPNSRVSFDTLFGPCPYCTEGLSIQTSTTQ